MLDSETKRRIDTCRDILVGKVPDPKSQVEQITIALIYKFMDDMDAEAEELGGKRTFFAGEYEKYGWSRLMAPNMGGFDVLALYSEAIQKMNENPGIPALFRDIFKNAYLPYRDPETLRIFLKEIDGFTYDHSEKLGDAFEYLLSVLGSQGDAGQFRTPRHIIDFMVEIIDPKKGESILDPACGTAGFLISAWKHILKSNTKARSGDLLTPDERKYLAANISGYDISPDMVRLSLVNMYLHGFTDPHIVEYDTLTSEEKWNEYADVILANPPFMSPKGGIKPHKRFSIQATRSEVLFVDYMAEHLTPNGRAAIIVPDGIIFQSQTAYKQLRKMLLDTSLVAVVSLPAGVFQPYSGVKTSILILDKSLAKKSDRIAFYKVENDGFGLGAQRRVINKNDTPEVVASLKQWLNSLRSGDVSSLEESNTCLIVEKGKIAANGDYNLSGERYRVEGVKTTEYELFQIGSLVETVTPPAKIQKTDFSKTGKYPIIDQSKDDIAGWTDDESALVRPCKPFVIFGDHTCVVKLVEAPFAQGADGIKILQTAENLNPCFLYHMLHNRPLESNGYQRHFSKLKEHKIPLPSLEVQQEIVAEIEGYQNVVDSARTVISNYSPYISIHPEWPMVVIDDIVDFVSGLTVSIPEVEAVDGTPIIAINNVTEDGNLTLDGLRLIKPPTKTLNYVQKGDLLFNWRNGSKHLVGKTALFDLEGQFLFASFLLGIRPRQDRVDSRYLWHTLNIYRREGRYLQFMRQNVNGLFNREELRIVEIPLPPLSTQQSIVAEIEAEQALVNGNRELITRFEKKIQATLARVWGEEA